MYETSVIDPFRVQDRNNPSASMRCPVLMNGRRCRETQTDRIVRMGSERMGSEGRIRYKVSILDRICVMWSVRGAGIAFVLLDV